MYALLYISVDWVLTFDLRCCVYSAFVSYGCVLVVKAKILDYIHRSNFV
jgi:hypothetical protein